MEELFIPVIAGTVREGRRSFNAAKLVKEIGEKQGIKTQLVDPRDFNMPGDGNSPDDKDPKYSELTNRADAFFIVSPEYNHSFPGSLKRMLDSEKDNYLHKPVVLAGVSIGPWGGVRVIESLSHVTRKLGMINTIADVHFPNIGQLFSEDGELQDPAMVKRIEDSWQELIWMAKVMRAGKQNIPRS